MSNRCVRGILAGWAVCLASGWASAGVTVLDKPQLGVFTTIQAAVDAASHGDILLVDPGSYTGFTIDNKALVVLATATGVQVNGTSKVINLTLNHNVSLIGMKLYAVDQQLDKTAGLELASNVGNVRVQSCTLKGARYIVSNYNWIVGNAVRATASTRVIFTQCTLTGRDVGFDSGSPGRPGGDAANLTDSSVAFYDCTLKGGRGSDETYPAGGKGGAACRVTNYGVFVSGSTLTGGTGGGGDYIGCTTAGEGGDALVLESAQAQLLSATLVAGLGNGYYSCYPGVNGQQLVNNGGVANVLNGTRRKMTSPAIATDNSSVPFTITGVQGDNVWLLFGKKPAFLFVASLNGVVAIPSPWFTVMIPAGQIGAGGTLIFNYPVGDVQGATEGWMWNVQGFIRGPNGSYVSSPLQILLRNT